MQLNTKLSKLAKTKYQQIFKNPQTDILYEKTRPDILENLSIEIGQPKEKLYKYLDIDEKTWLEKLNDKNKITVREILELAQVAQASIDIGRPTGRCDFFETITGEDNFNQKIFDTIKDLSKRIDKDSTEKNKKGLIARCCGVAVMTTLKDDESIRKTYSLDSSFEMFNQCLYAFSICCSYTPKEKDNQTEKQMNQEILKEKTIEYLNLVPYTDQNTVINNIKERIKEFIKTEDPSILQLILNTKDKIKEQKLEQLNAEQFIFLMAINGFKSFSDNTPENDKNGIQALEAAYKDISNKINQIPENVRENIAKELNIPNEFLMSQPGQPPQCDKAEYLIKMSVVTNSPFCFSEQYITESKKQYQEEKETAYSIQNEKNKTVKPADTLTDEPLELCIQEPVVMKPEQKQQTIDTLKEYKNKIRKAGEENKELFPFLLPLIREYFDLELDETFSLRDVKFKIKVKNNVEELYADNNKKADLQKNKNEIADLAIGNMTEFQRTEFNPKNGDNYWTFNVPVSLDPVKKVWGENPYADGISKMLNIVYKKESEIKRANIEDIKKQLLS